MTQKKGIKNSKILLLYDYSGVRPSNAASVQIRDNKELGEQRAPNTRFYRFL